ncbi:MAG: ABC transporter permease [Gammaproteobacteria bacterium]|nr:ABC transporter permease [Gammaproteobacteria bacterium]
MTPSQQWTAFRTLVTREILRFSRIWVQTILPPAITTVLYFVIFGNLIGGRIGQMDGLAYIDYIIPGLIMMTVITNSYANVVSSFYGSKFQKNIEEMLVSPMPNYLILLGYTAGGVARGMIVGLVVTLISLLFANEIVFAHPFLTVLVVLLTSILFALGGFINAVYAKSFDDISIIPTFVLTPLTYLGGVFYSINLLPEFWQWASKANPILYMVNAFRYGILGISDIDVTTALALICAFIVALFWFCLSLLQRGIGIRN